MNAEYMRRYPFFFTEREYPKKKKILGRNLFPSVKNLGQCKKTIDLVNGKETCFVFYGDEKLTRLDGSYFKKFFVGRTGARVVRVEENNSIAA